MKIKVLKIKVVDSYRYDETIEFASIVDQSDWVEISADDYYTLHNYLRSKREHYIIVTEMPKDELLANIANAIEKARKEAEFAKKRQVENERAKKERDLKKKDKLVEKVIKMGYKVEKT